jgi:hypothetical protein
MNLSTGVKLICSVSEEAVVADSGPYAYGMAFGAASAVAGEYGAFYN